MASALRGMALFCSMLVCVARVMAADPYPPHQNQSIRIVVPFAAGSASDTAARIIAEEARGSFGAIVVENKAGANGVMGASSVAKAKGDGLTLALTSSSTHSGIEALFRSPGYDPVKDFEHVGRIAVIPLLLVVRDDAPYKSAKELVAASRSNRLRFAYGNGSSQIATATFNAVSGTAADAIPYKSQPQAVTDLLGGQVDYILADSSVVTSFIRAGRLRALAISGTARAPDFPAIPTLQESGYGDFNVVVWVGLAAPAGTPPAIAEAWNIELRRVLAQPKVIERLGGLGMAPAPNTLAEHARFAQEQRAVWTQRAAKAGLEPQ